MELNQAQRDTLKELWLDESKKDAFEKAILSSVAMQGIELSVVETLRLFEGLELLLGDEREPSVRLNGNR